MRLGDEGSPGPVRQIEVHCQVPDASLQPVVTSVSPDNAWSTLECAASQIEEGSPPGSGQRPHGLAQVLWHRHFDPALTGLAVLRPPGNRRRRGTRGRGSVVARARRVVGGGAAGQRRGGGHDHGPFQRDGGRGGVSGLFGRVASPQGSAGESGPLHDEGVGGDDRAVFDGHAVVDKRGDAERDVVADDDVVGLEHPVLLGMGLDRACRCSSVQREPTVTRVRSMMPQPSSKTRAPDPHAEQTPDQRLERRPVEEACVSALQRHLPVLLVPPEVGVVDGAELGLKRFRNPAARCSMPMGTSKPTRSIRTIRRAEGKETELIGQFEGGEHNDHGQ